MSQSPILSSGSFVRVKESSEFRPGMDGMAIESDDGKEVGLVFFCDRYGDVQRNTCMGVELWALNELDLSTACN